MRSVVFITVFIFSIAALILLTQDLNDIGLNVLTLVKKIRQEQVDLELMQTSSTALNHSIFDSLLMRYVTTDGRVNYKGFLQEKSTLTTYLQQLSKHPPNPELFDKSYQLAYWINAYNAFTIALILGHYPLKGIKDIADGLPMIDSPWDIKFFEIGGIPFDLNTIEHDILRRQFDEPRIHFAINCASISCPKLMNNAFTAEKLEHQLHTAANAFINDPEKNKITSNELALSQIFIWFKVDFEQKGSLQEYLRPYLPVEVTANASITFLPYNWDLNE